MTANAHFAQKKTSFDANTHSQIHSLMAQNVITHRPVNPEDEDDAPPPYTPHVSTPGQPQATLDPRFGANSIAPPIVYQPPQPVQPQPAQPAQPQPRPTSTQWAPPSAFSHPSVPPHATSAPTPTPAPPLAPGLVTHYKCRECGSTLESETAVCKRIHTPSALYEGARIGRLTATPAPPQTYHQPQFQQPYYYPQPNVVIVSGTGSGPPTVYNNYGTNDVYLRRSLSVQNPVSTLRKFWRDAKQEYQFQQQRRPAYDVVAPPPLATTPFVAPMNVAPMNVPPPGMYPSGPPGPPRPPGPGMYGYGPGVPNVPGYSDGASLNRDWSQSGSRPSYH